MAAPDFGGDEAYRFCRVFLRAHSNLRQKRRKQKSDTRRQTSG
jgi:hypothetical protein